MDLDTLLGRADIDLETIFEEDSGVNVARLDPDLQKLQVEAIERLQSRHGRLVFPMSFIVLQQVLRKLTAIEMRLKNLETTQNTNPKVKEETNTPARNSTSTTRRRTTNNKRGTKTNTGRSKPSRTKGSSKST
jgi:hypothetical protein